MGTGKMFRIPKEVDGNTNLIIRVVHALKDCVAHTNKQPVKIFLTLIDQQDCYLLTTNQVGLELINLIFRYGVREAFHIFSDSKLGGLPIVWDAEESKIE